MLDTSCLQFLHQLSNIKSIPTGYVNLSQGLAAYEVRLLQNSTYGFLTATNIAENIRLQCYQGMLFTLSADEHIITVSTQLKAVGRTSQ